MNVQGIDFEVDKEEDCGFVPDESKNWCGTAVLYDEFTIRLERWEFNEPFAWVCDIEHKDFRREHYFVGCRATTAEAAIAECFARWSYFTRPPVPNEKFRDPHKREYPSPPAGQSISVDHGDVVETIWRPSPVKHWTHKPTGLLVITNPHGSHKWKVMFGTRSADLYEDSWRKLFKEFRGLVERNNYDRSVSKWYAELLAGYEQILLAMGKHMG